MNASPEEQAITLVADAIGDVIEFWGFRKILGRVWTVLFLASEPLSADELAEALHVSAGSMSSALNELLRWGVIYRVPRLGERKERFEAETDFWKMISRVLSDRERSLVRSVRERLERATTLLKEGDKRGGSRRARERLDQLLAFTKIGESVIEATLLTRKVDFSRFGDVLSLATRRRSS
jgi:DNA-binding transcriptional regulator GbsR (MarR family)